MADRAIAQTLSNVSGQFGDLYNRQLQQLQRNQQAQATLALQKELADLDRVFIGKINQQMSDTARGIPITEDWMNEDFRQEQMRQMFDERMQNVRGMVSTPAGQMEFENRQESMWHQYEENWKQKSTATMVAWNQQAEADQMDQEIQEATLETAADIYARRSYEFRQSVASGTWSAHQSVVLDAKFKETLWDNVLRRHISNPHESDGGPIEDMRVAHSSAYDEIEKAQSEGHITAAHMDDLKRAADSVLEHRREAVSQGMQTSVVRSLQSDATRLMAFGRGVEINYNEALNKFVQDNPEEWAVMSDEQKKEFNTRGHVEIQRLNQELRDAGSGSGAPGSGIPDWFEFRMKEIADGSRSAAIESGDTQDPDSFYNQVITDIQGLIADRVIDADRGATLSNRVRNIRDRLTEEYETMNQRYIHNPVTLAEFNEVLKRYGIRENTFRARVLEKWVSDQAGISDGNVDFVTSKHLQDFAQKMANDAIFKEQERQWYDHLFPDSLASDDRMVWRPGIQVTGTLAGLGVMSATNYADTPSGAILTAVVRDALGESFSRGSGEFDQAAMDKIAQDLLTEPGEKFSDLDPRLQKFIRTMSHGAGLMREAFDLGARALMHVDHRDGILDNGYTYGDVRWNEVTGLPIFMIEVQDPDSDDVAQFHFQVDPLRRRVDKLYWDDGKQEYTRTIFSVNIDEMKNLGSRTPWTPSQEETQEYEEVQESRAPSVTNVQEREERWRNLPEDQKEQVRDEVRQKLSEWLEERPDDRRPDVAGPSTATAFGFMAVQFGINRVIIDEIFNEMRRR